jgi:hypothetical protein
MPAKPDPYAELEKTWHPARLIPTTGIGGQEEQERRATSSLLAVMHGVPQFARALLSHVGAPAGRVATYQEVQLRDGDEVVSIPDGAIVVERGKTRWRCLVEVKTSGAPLRSEQISRYLDLARMNAFDAVLTISNHITSGPDDSPVQVDGRRTRRVALRHLSWSQVLTDAIVQHRHVGVTDPDQAWILGELIAYLDNERSGAGGFEDMGDKWVGVRDGARQLTLRANDPGVREVASRWEQFVQYVCQGLQRDLGRDVVPIWERGLVPDARIERRVRGLAEAGRLEGTIRVPDAAAPIQIEADLRARLLTTSMVFDAPREGRAKTRISWLLRQLPDALVELRVDAWFANTKETTSQLLGAVRERPERLLLPSDPRREPRSFAVALARELGPKRGRGPGSFVHDSRTQTLDFYRLVVQQLRAWAPAPPRLPEEPKAGPAVATAAPPDFSATDAREPGEGKDPETVSPQESLSRR